MLLLTCRSIQSFAFQENPGEVALKRCVIASYFEDATVLCIDPFLIGAHIEGTSRKQYFVVA